MANSSFNPSSQPWVRDMQHLDIAVRAYVRKTETPLSAGKPNSLQKKSARRKSPEPSEWVLVFDTETTTDASQKLRFGTYQVRKGEELFESGLFYDPDTLSTTELNTLREYAETHHLVLLAESEFIENVFYRVGYKYRASIVGFNLPFDISRLAIGHAPARTTKHNKIMQDGFSFKLSKHAYQPRVQIKHVSSRDSFIQFAATMGQRTSKGDRKKQRRQSVRRGFFLDIKTLAAALTSTSHSLASLAKALNVEAQKHATEEHGGILTPEYIAYALQDTQVAWECFCELKALYALHGLKLTGVHKIHSEASLGKAYLREMGIQPWMQLQADFPPELMGWIMSTYYGGRSEIHIRRQITQVLYYDFLSMYPTVCTLMGLWRLVTAQGMTWQDTTNATRHFLEKVTLAELQQQDTWRSLCTIVQVMPDDDIFPVRAKYNGDSQYTIGSNYLTSHTPLWFTLADCIATKLLTGRAPKILQAVSFTPMGVQSGLTLVNIAGNKAYRVDPRDGDFFRQIIDLRTTIKKRIKSAHARDKATLESQQLALKILANATSYGIFVELNVEEDKNLLDMLCYGASGKAIPMRHKKFEAAGAFFHPLLATLITGAAKLLLAITEYLTTMAGLDWALCDTDSMALAKPEAMPNDEFIEKAQQVQEWFTPLNPYSEKAPLLKIEDYNYDANKVLQPLYCLAISSKRYALFNIENGAPILRKVSAHGLGHLISPYNTADNVMLEDAQPWQQDLWLGIIEAELSGRQPNYTKLRNFNAPAISRYSATTPELEKWFATHNRKKPYRDRVRPFNFLLAMQALRQLKRLKPVSPYYKDHSKALHHCFDRATGSKVDKRQLKTYLDALAQYHLHPESKFLNGDFTDRGYTGRRHITVNAIRYIGKEANKWEEQSLLGADPDAQIEYGVNPDDKNRMLQRVWDAITAHGAKAVAQASRLSPRHVRKVLHGQSQPSGATLAKLYAAARSLEAEIAHAKNMLEKINATIATKNITVRGLAAKLDVDPSNLSKILSGRRASAKLLTRIKACVEGW